MLILPHIGYVVLTGWVGLALGDRPNCVKVLGVHPGSALEKRAVVGDCLIEVNDQKVLSSRSALSSIAEFHEGQEIKLRFRGVGAVSVIVTARNVEDARKLCEKSRLERREFLVVGWAESTEPVWRPLPLGNYTVAQLLKDLAIQNGGARVLLPGDCLSGERPPMVELAPASTEILPDSVIFVLSQADMKVRRRAVQRCLADGSCSRTVPASNHAPAK